MNSLRVVGVTITPVAFHDPPLLNTIGVHEPFALRSIIEVETDDGLIGLGETYGGSRDLTQLQAIAPRIVGLDVFALNELRERIRVSVSGNAESDPHSGVSGTETGAVDRLVAAFDVAFLDIQGKVLGRPVSDLLGGAVRSKVPYSAYLFYKWAAHPGAEPDRYGAALDPDGIVAQARWMIGEYGFTAIKLKGGVFPPAEEIAAVRALHREFPDHPLRIDPNAAWSVPTSIKVGAEVADILEYLEDPTPNRDGMAEVAAAVPMPLATNMCVMAFDQIPDALAKKSVGVILSDHHFWGGLTRSHLLAGVCETFGIGLSMHSNSHLGISLAAMTHLGAATPNLTYACDTHWPWKDAADDVVVAGVLQLEAGSVTVPTSPGLGVELDRDALARLHEQYLTCGIRSRDDTGYMRRIDPSYELKAPRW